MNYQKIEQRSQEWWMLKVGKVSGTRYGQLISSRENMLIDEMANEIMDKHVEWDDFENEDMIFGNENEPIAIDKYEKVSGLKFERGGVIISETLPSLHMASPDAINLEKRIVVEVKCTMHGKTQINRYRNGIDTKYLPQVLNYFAVSPEVEEVHWISYCPFRPERELVILKFTRNTVIESKETKKDGLVVVTIQDKINEGAIKLQKLEKDLNELINNFKQLEF